MKNMKIGARLTLGFLVVIALLLITSGAGIYQFRTINAELKNMMDNTIEVERHAREWSRQASNHGLILYAFAYSEEPDLIQRFAKQMSGYSERIDAVVKQINAAKLNPDEIRMLKEIDEKRAAYREQVASLFKINNVTASGEIIGKQPPFSALRDFFMNKVVPARDAYVAAVDAFRDYEIKDSEMINERLAETNRFAQMLQIIVSAIATMIAMLMAWRLTIGITRPLNEAVHIAEVVASGDLTSRVEITSRDEIGQLMQALKEMNEYLYNTVSQVRQSADTIATASSQIASGNQDLSSRTEQQASSLEETASSMEEITSTVRQNGDNARQANQLANQAAEVATRGGEAAGKVADTMSDIAASSNKIVDIISVIDGIAFQTNILALNAAVEAARAGEQGRGFAVVATEVRSLAQRSATAAREIKDLIDDSVSKVSTGTELVNNAVNTMLEIGESIRRVNDIMNEITMATQEQVQGIEQVNQAVTEMDTVSQQNAALVEEAAAAAESLQDQARALVGMMSMFNTGAGNSAMAAARPAIASGARPAAKPAPKPAARPALAAPAKAAASPARQVAASSADDGEEWEEF